MGASLSHRRYAKRVAGTAYEKVSSLKTRRVVKRNVAAKDRPIAGRFRLIQALRLVGAEYDPSGRGLISEANPDRTTENRRNPSAARGLRTGFVHTSQDQRTGRIRSSTARGKIPYAKVEHHQQARPLSRLRVRVQEAKTSYHARTMSGVSLGENLRTPLQHRRR